MNKTVLFYDNHSKIPLDFNIVEKDVSPVDALAQCSYPDFHTPVCVATALARHNNFRPISLNSEQYTFLEVGLVESKQNSLFPEIFSFPKIIE